jgi:Histidine kinase-, DNA gyrase B-, and HSP90-like ATPase
MADNENGDSRANANPSKSFFIAMLTRDIDLVDCILDLLDNSVDGIGEAARRSGAQLDADHPFEGNTVEIAFDRDSFRIADASGGIPIKVAEDYAFRFGRPDDAPELKDGTIGLYGIGMKRAIFKMGNVVAMQSSTGTESFSLNLNVDEPSSNAT